MGGLRMRKNPIFKIIMGLFFPPSILKLEFKTREELELMPQTEEELQVKWKLKWIEIEEPLLKEFLIHEARPVVITIFTQVCPSPFWISLNKAIF